MHIFVFACGVALAIGIWSADYRLEYSLAMEAKQNELADLTHYRALRLSDWVHRRLRDAQSLAVLPAIQDYLESEKRDPVSGEEGAGSAPVLRSYLDQLALSSSYLSVYLTDPLGKPLLQDSGNHPVPREAWAVSRAAVEKRRGRVALLADSSSNLVAIASMPVYQYGSLEAAGQETSAVLGSVTLVVSPSQTLLVRILGPDGAATSVRAFLVRIPETGRPQVLGADNTLSLANVDSLVSSKLTHGAVEALRQQEVSTRYRDRHGVAMMAALERVALTQLVLGTEIEESKGLEGLRRTGRLKLLSALLIVLAFAGLLVANYRDQIARDLRDQLERQQAVLRAREFADEIVQSIPAGLMVLTDGLRVAFVNQTLLEMFRTRAEDLAGKPLEEILSWQNPRIPNPALIERLREMEPLMVNLCPGGEGEERAMRMTFKALANGDDTGNLLLLVEDLSESEKLRAAVAASERRIREMVQSLDAIVWEVDADSGRFSFVSQRAETMLGYPVENWLSVPAGRLPFIHREDQAEFSQLFKNASAHGADHNLEFRATTANGGSIWLRSMLRAVRDAEGQVRRLRGVMLDVTERKQAESALRESEARKGAILESSLDGIITLDEDGRVIEFNAAAARILGYSRAEVVGRPLAEVLLPAKLAESGSMLNFPAGGNGSLLGKRVEMTGVRFDGSEFPAELSINSIAVAGRDVLTVCLRDLTERKQLERELWHSQKMEAVGQLAGGVAHDFNNLLTVIGGYSDLLLMHMPESDTLGRGSVSEIKKAGERAAALTRQLLAFSRRQVLAPQILDLNAVVSNMEKMMRRLIGEDVELVTALQENLSSVKADPGQLEQVLMNLAVNARDAMPQGGRLTIETHNAYLDEVFCRQHDATIAPGDYVVISVTDDGCGMDQDTLSRIFEPFFTTKEPGKGTGLGLATVYGIIKQSGGFIDAYSESGEGTTFKVYLPRANSLEAGEKPQEEAGRAQGGSETILLVEDEDAVRELVEGVLAASGYHVQTASRGDEALQIARRHSPPINLLLTDVVMPQMSGRELADQFALIHPETKVLFMSGYTETSMMRRGILNEDDQFIQKPFSADNLVRRIRSVLDAGQEISVHGA